MIRTKDASSLPATLCLMVTIQCFCWTVYGYVVHDVSTGVNNVVGFFLGLTQLALIFVYGNKRAAAAAAAAGGAGAKAAEGAIEGAAAPQGAAVEGEKEQLLVSPVAPASPHSLSDTQHR